LNLSASAAPWQLPARRRGRRRFLKVVALVLLAVAAAQYLGGFLFLWSLRLSTSAASPVTLARYGYYYGDVPAVRRRLLICASVGAGVVLASALVVLLPRRRPLHGEARFASRGEIVEAGLLGQHGIILGQLGRRCLVLPGQQGVALAAPPRAGKGTGIVVPNLLHWPDSVICVDIKRENWIRTAGFRQSRGQACYLFDPFAEDGRTAHWNPFHYVSEQPTRRVNDLQRIAEMLYPDPPNVDPFWTASARSLFLGIALYLFETPSMPKTIGEVLRQGMASDNEGFGEHWKRVIEGRKSGRNLLSPQCVRALYDVIDLAPVTGSSIRKTFTSRLDLWLNPILDTATATNDFDLRALRSTPMSIYVGVNPDDLHRLRPVLALFFQQAIGLQTRTLPEHDPTLTRQVLMLLDEFTALGRIPIIAESISYLPGYNVRVLLVIQTPAQLREVYGPNGTDIMLKSLGARIVFAPKDHADAREISDELGNTTIKVKTLSKPVFDFSDAKGRRSRSVSVSEQRRPLLLPQEVKALGAEEAIIFLEGLPPIRCRKIRYYSDKRFSMRLFPPPAVPTRLREPATVTQLYPKTAERPAMSPPAPPVEPSAGDVSAVDGGIVQATTSREPTLADIERIEQIPLEELDVDLSQVQLPDKERLTRREINHAVVTFMASLPTR
jgi:type IV secretion system protein VirD4